MQILELTPHYFRAFGDKQTIQFSQELTIFYGGNGTGKSSLAEALEWLFYGYTTRRRKGDKYSKTEYKNSYVNKKCPKDVIPYVEASLKFSDGMDHLLRREIFQDDSGNLVDTQSKLCIDGKEIASLSQVGINLTEAHRPIVVQHGIQDFIHTKPIERYRIISEALGLAELVEFKDVLKKAKNQYKNYPLPELQAATKKANNLANILNQLQLTNIAKCWQKNKYDVENDYKEIAKAANELIESPTLELEQLIVRLRAKQTEKMSRIFNIVPHRPSADYDSNLKRIESLLAQFQESLQIFRQASAELTGAVASTYSHAQILFWQDGLTLIDQDHPQICPFCEQSTLTQEHLDQHHARIKANKALSDARTTFEKQIDNCNTKITGIERALQTSQIKPVSSEAEITLRHAFEANVEDLEKFLAANQEITNLLQAFQIELRSKRTFFEKAKKKIDNPQEILQLAAELPNLLDYLQEQLIQLKVLFPKNVEIYVKFEPILKRELSDEATVAKYTNFINLIEGRQAVEMVSKSKNLDKEILACQRKTDQYILEKQKEILQTREREIVEWYGNLSPNTDVQFSGIVPGRNEFRLKAEAFGNELEAAACLSQAQLNCLGLSIYIPSVIDKNSPFNFIFFDDPVQAMDDDHHDSFLETVLPELLDNYQSQVVVLTHIDKTAKRIRTLNVDKNYYFYRFEKLQPTGPVIREDQFIKDLETQISNLSFGDESERALAVDRIRVLSELIMREACLKNSIITKPNATASNLLKEFRKLQDVSAKQANKLQDTIRWSDPAHHTDQTWTIPPKEEIDTHISRLKSFIIRLKL